MGCIEAQLNGETPGAFVTCVTIVSPAEEANAATLGAAVTKVTIVTYSDCPDIHGAPHPIMGNSG